MGSANPGVVGYPKRVALFPKRPARLLGFRSGAMLRRTPRAGGDPMSRTNGSEVVVVTGASAGVGRATARAFGSGGAWIGLLARGRDGLEAACHEIEAGDSRN